jgi:hypothetical protein
MGENTNISHEHLLRNFLGKVTTPDYTTDERQSLSSKILGFFVIHTSRVCPCTHTHTHTHFFKFCFVVLFFIAGYHFKNTPSCFALGVHSLSGSLSMNRSMICMIMLVLLLRNSVDSSCTGVFRGCKFALDAFC